MKVGVIGVPGSGKSKFAKGLQREWSNHSIIDNYVPALARRSGLAYGPYGNYIDNMQVAFKRRELELARDSKFDGDRITCGTIVDTNAYAFLTTDALATNRRELLSFHYQRIEAIMRAFGFLYTECFDYDYTFYLPYDGEDAFAIKLDEGIRAALEAYWSPTIRLGIDEQVTTAIETIGKLEAENQATPDDERGVRSGGGDGKNKRDSA